MTDLARLLPPALWMAAFWVAVLGYARRVPSGEGSLRFPLGLVLGAIFAHLGWALLHLDAVSRHPHSLLDVSSGMSVLFVPLGILLVAAPAPREERSRFLAAAFGSLPLALVTARLGCLAAGCCHGLPSDVPWALSLGPDEHLRHPTALYEIAGLLGLAAVVHWLPARFAAGAVLAGLGALRLALEPLRSPPPLGEPVVPASLIAVVWVVAGLLLASRSRLRGRGVRRLRTASRSGVRRGVEAGLSLSVGVTLAFPHLLPGRAVELALLLLAGGLAVGRRFGGSAVLRGMAMCAAVGVALEWNAIRLDHFRQAIPGALWAGVPVGWASLGLVALAHAGSLTRASTPARVLAGAAALAAIGLVWDPIGLRAGWFAWPGGGSYVPELRGFEGSRGIPLWSFAAWAAVGAIGVAALGRPRRESASPPFLFPAVMAGLLVHAARAGLGSVAAPALLVAAFAFLPLRSVGWVRGAATGSRGAPIHPPPTHEQLVSALAERVLPGDRNHDVSASK